MNRENRVEYVDRDRILEQADAFGSQGKFAEAIDCYTRAVDLDPTDSLALYHRGHCWMALGEYDRALADFSGAVEIEPDNPYLYMSRATARYAAGHYREAVEDSDAAYRLRADMADEMVARVLYGRAMSRRALGDHEAAEADHRLGRESDPDGRLVPPAW